MILIDEAVGRNRLVEQIEEAKEYLKDTRKEKVNIETIVPREIDNIPGAIAEYFELDIPEEAGDDWEWNDNSWAEIDEQLDQLIAEFSGRLIDHLDGHYLQFEFDDRFGFFLMLFTEKKKRDLGEDVFLPTDKRIFDFIQL